MKSLLLVTLCLALPAQALAQDLPQWRDVISNDTKFSMTTPAVDGDDSMLDLKRRQ